MLSGNGLPEEWRTGGTKQLLESEFSKRLCTNAKSRDIVTHRIENTASNGTPDIFMFRGADVSWVETKVVRGNETVVLRGQQVIWLDRYARAGNIARIAAFHEQDSCIYIWPASEAKAVYENGIYCGGSAVFPRPYNYDEIFIALLTGTP